MILVEFHGIQSDGYYGMPEDISNPNFVPLHIFVCPSFKCTDEEFWDDVRAFSYRYTIETEKVEYLRDCRKDPYVRKWPSALQVFQVTPEKAREVIGWIKEAIISNKNTVWTQKS